ncbi:MAG: sigma-70 family RNA polymerase sigma factor, partial [Candidatus Omnitrophica bacterium]|nr:sigma-70 family RNA polymerase sigma factor [Candidatus Omnitrophota bacterium]
TGNLIGKLYSHPDAKPEQLMTEGIIGIEESRNERNPKHKHLVFYFRNPNNGNALQPLYTKDSRQNPDGTRTQAMVAVRGRVDDSTVVIADKKHIYGFANTNKRYIPESFLNGKPLKGALARYHEEREQYWANALRGEGEKRGDNLPEGVNSHTKIRGCGEDIRKAVKDGLKKGKLKDGFDAGNLIRYLEDCFREGKLPPTRRNEAEFALMRYNSSLGRKGTKLLWGEQDEKFDSIVNESFKKTELCMDVFEFMEGRPPQDYIELSAWMSRQKQEKELTTRYYKAKPLPIGLIKRMMSLYGSENNFRKAHGFKLPRLTGDDALSDWRNLARVILWAILYENGQNREPTEKEVDDFTNPGNREANAHYESPSNESFSKSTSIGYDAVQKAASRYHVGGMAASGNGDGHVMEVMPVIYRRLGLTLKKRIGGESLGIRENMVRAIYKVIHKEELGGREPSEGEIDAFTGEAGIEAGRKADIIAPTLTELGGAIRESFRSHPELGGYKAFIEGLGYRVKLPLSYPGALLESLYKDLHGEKSTEEQLYEFATSRNRGVRLNWKDLSRETINGARRFYGNVPGVALWLGFIPLRKVRHHPLERWSVYCWEIYIFLYGRLPSCEELDGFMTPEAKNAALPSDDDFRTKGREDLVEYSKYHGGGFEVAEKLGLSYEVPSYTDLVFGRVDSLPKAVAIIAAGVRVESLGGKEGIARGKENQREVMRYRSAQLLLERTLKEKPDSVRAAISSADSYTFACFLKDNFGAIVAKQLGLKPRTKKKAATLDTKDPAIGLPASQHYLEEVIWSRRQERLENIQALIEDGMRNRAERPSGASAKLKEDFEALGLLLDDWLYFGSQYFGDGNVEKLEKQIGRLINDYLNGQYIVNTAREARAKAYLKSLLGLTPLRPQDTSYSAAPGETGPALILPSTRTIAGWLGIHNEYVLGWFAAVWPAEIIFSAIPRLFVRMHVNKPGEHEVRLFGARAIFTATLISIALTVSWLFLCPFLISDMPALFVTASALFANIAAHGIYNTIMIYTGGPMLSIRRQAHKKVSVFDAPTKASPKEWERVREMIPAGLIKPEGGLKTRARLLTTEEKTRLKIDAARGNTAAKEALAVNVKGEKGWELVRAVIPDLVLPDGGIVLEVKWAVIRAPRILTRDEEIALAKLKDKGYIAAVDALVLTNMGLAVTQAMRICRNPRYEDLGLEMDDIVSAAVYGHRAGTEDFAGLYRAAVLYEHNMGYPFSTYASRLAYGAAQSYAEEELKKRGRDLPIRRYRGEEARGGIHDNSLVFGVVEETILDRRWMRDDLMNIISKTLRQREQTVIISRFGLVSGEPQTLREISSLMGITKERVHQIEARALDKLRKEIERRRGAKKTTGLILPSTRAIAEKLGIHNEYVLGWFAAVWPVEIIFSAIPRLFVRMHVNKPGEHEVRLFGARTILAAAVLSSAVTLSGLYLFSFLLSSTPLLVVISSALFVAVMTHGIYNTLAARLSPTMLTAEKPYYGILSHNLQKVLFEIDDYGGPFEKIKSQKAVH